MITLLRLGRSLLLIFVLVLPIFGSAAALCEGELTVPFKASRAAQLKWLYDFAWKANDHSQVDSVARQLLARPEREVSAWINLMAENYLELASGPVSPNLRAVLGGKRVVDRLLFWLQRYEEKVATSVPVIGPRESLMQVLREQVRLFKSPCAPDDIFKIVRGFQGVIADWQKNHPQSAPLSLVVGGSFINGKIRRGSDVDIHFSDASVARDLLPRLKEIANSLPDENCRPRTEPHGEGELFYGRINPIAMKLSQSGYELFMFKPRSGQTMGSFPPVSDFKTYRW